MAATSRLHWDWKVISPANSLLGHNWMSSVGLVHCSVFAMVQARLWWNTIILVLVFISESLERHALIFHLYIKVLPFLYILWIFWHVFWLLQLISQNKLTLGFSPYSSWKSGKFSLWQFLQLFWRWLKFLLFDTVLPVLKHLPHSRIRVLYLSGTHWP